MPKTLHSPKYKKLINWLREERLSKGYSVRKLAEILGEHHSYVGKVEQCERRLDVVEYIDYCEGLEVSPVTGLNIIR